MLVQLQKLSSIPRILSTFAEDSDNPGELAFMVIEDPSSNRSLSKADTYQNWDLYERIRFASQALDELDKIHSHRITSLNSTSAPILHRNLSPDAIRASSHDGQPIFTRFHLASIDPNKSVVSGSGISLDDEAREYAAPEVLKYGLSVADTHSDVYSLARILERLFISYSDEALAHRALSILGMGYRANPKERNTAREMAVRLDELLLPGPVNARDEDQFLLDPDLWDETTQIHLPGKSNQN